MLTITVVQENLLLDAMFEIPGSDIAGVHVTGAAVRREEAPIYSKGNYPVEQEEDPQIEVQLKTT